MRFSTRSLSARILVPALLTVSALFLLTLPALAQQPTAPPLRPGGPAPAPGAPGGQGRGGRQGQRGGRGVSLAMLPINVLDLITPLKADQKSKIGAIETKARADLKTADRTTRGPILTKAGDDIKALLTPAQMADVQKALPTLGLVSQSRAIPIGALEEVKLTKPQMSKITGFASATATQLKGLQGEERRAKMQQVGPALKAQIEGVLTPVQKSVIAKYEAAHPRPQRGGFGGGQANGRPGVPNAGPGTAPVSRPVGSKPKS